MPTYEYRCRDCGEHLEVVQSFRDDSLTDCGRCGGALRKVFSAAPIVFKGSGYYVNDSRSASRKDSDSSSSGSDSLAKKTDDKSSKKSEAGAKTGTKSESKSSDGKSSESKSSDSAKSAESA